VSLLVSARPARPLLNFGSRIWDTASGQCLKTIVEPQSHDPCANVVFSPNSQYILCSTLDSTVRLWDYHHSKCVKTYKGHKNDLYALGACFSYTSKNRVWIVSGSEDHKIYLWDLQSREIAQVLEGHTGAHRFIFGIGYS